MTQVELRMRSGGSLGRGELPVTLSDKTDNTRASDVIHLVSDL